MINTKTLVGLKGLADRLKLEAGTLCYNIRNRRVTHTQKHLPELKRTLVSVCEACEDADTFASQLYNTLLHCQTTPTEFAYSTDSEEVFIQGSFSVARLRHYVAIARLEMLIDGMPEVQGMPEVRGGDNAQHKTS